MTNPKDDQSREEFEKWYNWKLEGCPESLKPDPDWLFNAWQASRATTSDAVRELVGFVQRIADEGFYGEMNSSADLVKILDEHKDGVDKILSRINGELK